MDCALYHCTQLLTDHLYKTVVNTVGDLFNVIYRTNPHADSKIKQTNWEKVLATLPSEMKDETPLSAFKKLYKKTMMCYLKNVLKTPNQSSVAATQFFVQSFMTKLMEHPTMQAQQDYEPAFFAQNGYSSQRQVIQDVLRHTLYKISEDMGLHQQSAPTNMYENVSVRIKNSILNGGFGQSIRLEQKKESSISPPKLSGYFPNKTDHANIHATNRSVHATKKSVHATDRSVHATDRSVHATNRSVHATNRSVHATNRSVHANNVSKVDKNTKVHARSVHASNKSTLNKNPKNTEKEDNQNSRLIYKSRNNNPRKSIIVDNVEKSRKSGKRPVSKHTIASHHSTISHHPKQTKSVLLGGKSQNSKTITLPGKQKTVERTHNVRIGRLSTPRNRQSEVESVMPNDSVSCAPPPRR